MRGFLEASDADFVSGDIDSISIRDIEQRVNDEDYLSFLIESNGGFYCHKSIQMYGLSKLNHHNLKVINNQISELFDKMFMDLFSIGQDVFGNQFMIGKDRKIFFCNIETGEKEFIATGFNKWIEVVSSDLEYFSGERISVAWELYNGSFDYSSRLCPKKPFI
ncbi:MAG: SMI1/KNR4 family protein, partial [Bacteroidota bacterium]